MRLRRIVPIFALAILLAGAVGYAVQNYSRPIEWSNRAYITPLKHTITVPLDYLGYDDLTGSTTDAEEGHYKTWEADMDFTATISGINATLFSVFNVTITMDSETVTVGIADASETITIEAGKNGDVVMHVDWEVYDEVEIGNENSGTATIIFDVDTAGA